MNITLAQAIRNAIQSERAGHLFYAHLARCSVEESARHLLMGMAEEEIIHAKGLEELAKLVIAAPLPEKASRYAEQVEVPIHWARIKEVNLTQALTLALDGENSAALYYEALADSCDGVVSEFFRGLSDGEKRHVEQVQELLQKHAA